MDRKSDIVIAPPDGYEAAGIVWRLKKPVYGLCSAPKSLYDRVREVATAAGLDCDVSDEAVFRLFDSSGSIIGILALNVDDTIGCGTSALFDAMRLIGSVLKIGAEESAKDGPFCMRVFVSLLAPSHMASIRESSPLQWTGTNIYKRQRKWMFLLVSQTICFLRSLQLSSGQ
jgi:hypothetical protein